MRKVSLEEAKLLRLQTRTVAGLQQYLAYELGLQPWPGKIGEQNLQDGAKSDNGWDNRTLTDFLEAMSAWIEDTSSIDELRDVDLNWRAMARFLEAVLNDQLVNAERSREGE